MRLSDLKLSESITGLIYGNSGTGKTYLAGTAGDRTLIITPSNGVATLGSKLFKALNFNPFIEIVDEVGVPKKAEGFDKISNIIDRYLKEFPNDIDTIIVDDVTNVRRMAMNKALEVNANIGRSKTIDSARRHEIVVPTVQDFGMEMAIIDNFIRFYASELKHLGKHFFMFAHERLTYEKGKTIGELPTLARVAPGFTGQTFPDDVTGLFDLTWHTEVKGSGDRTFYQIRTQGDSVITAKTRWGGIFPTLIEQAPHLSVIIKHIQSQTPYTNKR